MKTTTFRICGGTFSYVHNSGTAATVFTTQQPFLVCRVDASSSKQSLLGTKCIISQCILASAYFTMYASHDRQVGVHTDGSETDTATAGDVEMSRGFNLYYSQVAC